MSCLLNKAMRFGQGTFYMLTRKILSFQRGTWLLFLIVLVLQTSGGLPLPVRRQILLNPPIFETFLPDLQNSQKPPLFLAKKLPVFIATDAKNVGRPKLEFTPRPQ